MGITTLKWNFDGLTGEGFKIYRSLTPMLTSALPAPMTSLPIAARQFEDETVVVGEVYYYRVATYAGGSVMISEEISHEAGIAGDLYWDNVTALMPFNTNFANAAGGASWTPAGSAVISSAESVFGGGSAYNGRTSPRSSITGPSLPSMSGDFTIEFWAKVSGSRPVNATLFDMRPPSTNGAYLTFFLFNNHINLYFSNSYFFATVPVTIGTAWFHVAVVRKAGIITMYLNGTVVTAKANTTTFLIPRVLLGGNANTSTSDSSWDFQGFIDDFRITNGVARYDGTFTVPAEEFPTY